MRATCWMGKTDVQVQQVPEPKILNERDANAPTLSAAEVFP